MASVSSEIKDRNGELMGNINWRDGVITFYEDYKYADEVRQSIGEEKFSNAVSHFNTETDMPNNKQAEEALGRFFEEQSISQ